VVRSFIFSLICASLHAANPSTPIILISVDTLRADHLSCYEPHRQPTPHIDALAKNGTLFSQISSPFPLTLPSHVAMFTSTYAFSNGIDDNGVPLKSPTVTLATALKSSGYKTAAFVGSFILDRRFGLNQGFDVYDGPVDVHNSNTTVVERKRPGAQVVEAATHWLEHNSTAPFFLFLHLYDLHLPYDLPQDSSLRHGETGYTAELGYEDRVLGEFFSLLQRRGVFDKALIVFTSDHGEGLGDHGESTHGFLIYQSTLHVPLIVHWPAGFTRFPHNRVDEPASLVDVAPTILDTVGVSRPSAMRGRSLIAANSAGGEVYSESTYARNHFGCASIRSVREGRYKYVDAPKPELYDLASDPNELHNLYEQQRPKAADLRKKIGVVLASSPMRPNAKPAAPKPDTVEALRSLGYLGSGRSNRPESRIDPKDRMADFESYYRALDLSNAGKLAESTAVFRSLRDKLPEVADIQISLALNEQRMGDYAAAAREYKRGTEQAPGNALPHFELGFCYFRLGQTDDAIKELKAALALQPWYSRADEALAEIYLHKQDYAQAREYLNRLLAVDPNSYTAHYNLGIFAAGEKNWTEAERHISAAVRVDPNAAEAHDTLGKIYYEKGDLEQARREFETTVRLQPKLASAHFNLAMVLEKQGKSEQAAQEYRAAQAADAGSGKP